MTTAKELADTIMIAYRDNTPPYVPRYQPDNCPHCEYDRRFPETAEGGWVYPGNNGPIGPCPICNPHGTHPRARL